MTAQDPDRAKGPHAGNGAPSELERGGFDSEAPTLRGRSTSPHRGRPVATPRKPKVTHATLDEMVALLQQELESAPQRPVRHTPMRLVLRSGPAAKPEPHSQSAGPGDAPLPSPPRMPTLPDEAPQSPAGDEAASACEDGPPSHTASKDLPVGDRNDAGHNDAGHNDAGHNDAAKTAANGPVGQTHTTGAPAVGAQGPQAPRRTGQTRLQIGLQIVLAAVAGAALMAVAAWLLD